MVTKRELEYKLQEEKKETKDWKHDFWIAISGLFVMTAICFVLLYQVNSSIQISRIIPQEVCVNNTVVYPCEEKDTGLYTCYFPNHVGALVEVNKSHISNLSITLSSPTCTAQNEVCADGVCNLRYRK